VHNARDDKERELNFCSKLVDKPTFGGPLPLVEDACSLLAIPQLEEFEQQSSSLSDLGKVAHNVDTSLALVIVHKKGVFTMFAIVIWGIFLNRPSPLVLWLSL
jgi:hypothetical protein